MTGGTWTIGEVARQTGLPSKTIRYYEDIALVERATRADNGYRIYDRPSVEDVGELLALWRDEDRQSADVKTIAQHHIARVERKIAELESLRRTLLHLAEHCHGDHRPDCPILDDLADGPRR